MLDLILLFVLLFGFGFGTRSYVGAFVPGAVLVFAIVVYQQRTPTGDEVDVLDEVFVVASGLGVLIYLGGVALGRRLRRISPDGA